MVPFFDHIRTSRRLRSGNRLISLSPIHQLIRRCIPRLPLFTIDSPLSPIPPPLTQVRTLSYTHSLTFQLLHLRSLNRHSFTRSVMRMYPCRMLQCKPQLPLTKLVGIE